MLMEFYHTGVSFSELLKERLMPVKELVYSKYKEAHKDDIKTLGAAIPWLWKYDILTLVFKCCGYNRTVFQAEKEIKEAIQRKKEFHDAKEHGENWQPVDIDMIHKFLTDILRDWHELERLVKARNVTTREERYAKQVAAQKVILSYSVCDIKKMCKDSLADRTNLQNIDALLSDATNTVHNKWCCSKILSKEQIVKLYENALMELHEWVAENIVEDAADNHSDDFFYTDSWDMDYRDKQLFLCGEYITKVERIKLPKIIKRRGKLYDSVEKQHRDVDVYDYGRAWISETTYENDKKLFTVQVKGCNKHRLFNCAKKNTAELYIKALLMSGIPLEIDESKPIIEGGAFTEEFADLCRCIKDFILAYPNIHTVQQVPRYYYDEMSKKRWWRGDLAGFETADIENDSIEILAKKFAAIFDNAASPRHEKQVMKIVAKALQDSEKYFPILIHYINSGIKVGKKPIFASNMSNFGLYPKNVRMLIPKRPEYANLQPAKPMQGTLEAHLHKHVMRNYVTINDGKAVLEGVFYDVESKQIKASDGRQAVYLNEPNLSGESKVIRVGGCCNGSKGSGSTRNGTASYPDLSVLLNRQRDFMGYLNVPTFYKMVRMWQLIEHYFSDDRAIDMHRMLVTFSKWAEPITKQYPLDRIKYAVDLLLFRNEKGAESITVHVDAEVHASQRVLLLMLENSVGDKVIVAPITEHGGDEGGLRYHMPLTDNKPKTKTHKKGLLDLISK